MLIPQIIGTYVVYIYSIVCNVYIKDNNDPIAMATRGVLVIL